jgi:uncharacterized protein YndB with AHSA1/START domain
VDGTLESVGERWRLRFTRQLRHPAPKVWRAITEPEHLETWFPTGEVLAVEDGSVLEFRWGPDTIRLEIEPKDAGCTLTLTDTFDELGKAARDAAGWHECLDRLQDDLEGTTPPAWGERWAVVHPGYVAELGPEASAIGPPDSVDAGGG